MRDALITNALRVPTLPPLLTWRSNNYISLILLVSGEYISANSEKMQTWCIYMDEAGVNKEPQFIYATICIPFNSQQEFLKSYPEIVNPLVGISGREIKYGDLLNTDDRFHREETEKICQSLLTRFFEIKGARIVRVKAIRKQMQAKGGDLRVALFNKTLVLCKEFLPSNHHAMILHDELDSRDQQSVLLDTFNRFNKDLNFQNCVFVHSNENPFIQFADFIASICYRYYYFQQKEYKNKQYCASLVNSLFKAIDEHYSPIVELSEYTDVEGNHRKEQAIQLASKHSIDIATAYQIVDKKFTLDEALRRKQARTSTDHRQNEDKRKIRS